MNNKNIYRLVLGTAQFGMNYGIANKTGQPSTDEIAKILNLARHHGIHMIDTAIAYGDSEKNLGEVGLEGFEIVTKLPEIPDNTDIESWILAEVQSSLARLRVKQLYGLLLHKPQQINTRLGENIINTLGILKKEKLVKKIGVSVYSPEELSNILTRFIPDIVQLPFNLIDQRFLCTGWFDKLQERNIEVHSRSVFLQGLLLMPYQEVTQKFNRWHQLWNTWFDWLQASKMSPICASLCFVLNFPQIHRVIVGVDHSQQLHELIEVLLHTSQIKDFPMLATDDIELINPSSWSLK